MSVPSAAVLIVGMICLTILGVVHIAAKASSRVDEKREEKEGI